MVLDGFPLLSTGPFFLKNIMDFGFIFIAVLPFSVREVSHAGDMYWINIMILSSSLLS